MVDNYMEEDDADVEETNLPANGGSDQDWTAMLVEQLFTDLQQQQARDASEGARGAGRTSSGGTGSARGEGVVVGESAGGSSGAAASLAEDREEDVLPSPDTDGPVLTVRGVVSMSCALAGIVLAALAVSQRRLRQRGGYEQIPSRVSMSNGEDGVVVL